MSTTDGLRKRTGIFDGEWQWRICNGGYQVYTGFLEHVCQCESREAAILITEQHNEHVRRKMDHAAAE